jgi:hypothetical protein
MEGFGFSPCALQMGVVFGVWGFAILLIVCFHKFRHWQIKQRTLKMYWEDENCLMEHVKDVEKYEGGRLGFFGPANVMKATKTSHQLKAIEDEVQEQKVIMQKKRAAYMKRRKFPKRKKRKLPVIDEEGNTFYVDSRSIDKKTGLPMLNEV